MTMTRGDRVEIADYRRDEPGHAVVAIGVPTLGMVSIYFAARLLGLRMPINTACRHLYVVGREVGEARNEICYRALDIATETGGALRATHVLFLDDDVLFHPELLTRLMSHRRPIVSGLYYTKTMTPQPLMLEAPGSGTVTGWTHGDLVPVHAHGMGLCLIETRVLEAMREGGTLGTDRNGYPEWFKTTRDGSVRAADGVRAVVNETEDVWFCQRAKQAGFDLAVDTGAQAFGFHWDQSARVGYPLAQWHQFIAGQPIVWENADALASARW